jgi:hypothetical protein
LNKTVVDDQLPRPPFPGGKGLSTGGGCVTDGPFKDTKFRIGPFGQMKKDRTHCLTRDINPEVVEKFGGISKVRKIVNAKNFKEFMDQISRLDSLNLPPGGPGSFGPPGSVKGSGSRGSHASGPPKGSGNHGGHGSSPFPKGLGGKGPGGFPGGPGGFPSGGPGGFGPGGPFGDPDVHVIAHGAIGGEVDILSLFLDVRTNHHRC